MGRRHRSASGSGAAETPIRVAHVLGRLSQGGGVQVVIRRLAAATDRSRVDLHVISTRPRFDADRTEDVPVTLHPLGYTKQGFGPLDRIRLAIQVAQAVRRIDPDVVQLHSGTAWLGLVARLTSIRTAFLLEMHVAPGSGHHGRATDRMESWWVRYLGATAVCHSSSVQHEVETRWRPPAGRVAVFPLAVDVDTFQPPEPAHRSAWREQAGVGADARLLVGVGRFAPSKRFPDLVDLLGGCCDSGIDVGLVLIGSGAEEPTIRAAIERWGVADRVWLPGPIYDGDLADALGACDILCSPSEYEGFGLTLVEGMACGLPVVARAVGGVTDIVDPGVTGLLGDTLDELREAVADLLGDEARRTQMGAAGRDRAVARYSASAVAEAFATTYEAIGASHRARRCAGG